MPSLQTCRLVSVVGLVCLHIGSGVLPVQASDAEVSPEAAYIEIDTCVGTQISAGENIHWCRDRYAEPCSATHGSLESCLTAELMAWSAVGQRYSEQYRKAVGGRSAERAEAYDLELFEWSQADVETCAIFPIGDPEEVRCTIGGEFDRIEWTIELLKKEHL